MHRSFSIHGLHLRHDPEYDFTGEPLEDHVDPPDYCEYEDQFMFLAESAAKECGYEGLQFSEVWEENWNQGDWWEYGCAALGKRRIEGMVSDDHGLAYMVHAIAREASWTIGEDNREKKNNRKVALCFTYVAGEDRIDIESHEIGKCPVFRYDHELIKKRKCKVQVTFYVSTSVKDTDDDADVNRIIDRAIDEHFDEDNLQEKIYEELDYYTSDYDPTVYVRRDKVKVTDVPKTRKI
jgi:hypothetical protein